MPLMPLSIQLFKQMFFRQATVILKINASVQKAKCAKNSVE